MIEIVKKQRRESVEFNAAECALAAALHDQFHEDNPSLDEVEPWKYKTHMHRHPWYRRARNILSRMQSEAIAALPPGVEPVAWLRDLDGTGSLHACSEGDPGAIPVYAAPAPVAVTGKMVQDALDTFGHPPTFTAMRRALEAALSGQEGK